MTLISLTSIMTHFIEIYIYTTLFTAKECRDKYKTQCKPCLKTENVHENKLNFIFFTYIYRVFTVARKQERQDTEPLHTGLHCNYVHGNTIKPHSSQRLVFIYLFYSPCFFLHPVLCFKYPTTGSNFHPIILHTSRIHDKKRFIPSTELTSAKRALLRNRS